ncbi:Puffspecific protein Bx42like, partial [Caligus rogercresseyi]
MHSPTRKVTVKEQQDWKIPPCISNWKNQKGYTIPLDKRLAADGRGLQQVHINENFAKLAESLYIADRKARESVEIRASLEKKMAAKEKEEKESKLRELAQKAREERAGLRKPSSSAEANERDDLRQERHRERARQRNLDRAAPERRSKADRNRERDISEQIALGVPAKSAGSSS